MVKPRATLFAGLILVFIGCGGRASTDADRSTNGGAPVQVGGGSGSSPIISGGSGPTSPIDVGGGGMSTGTGVVDAGAAPPCTGSLAEVSQALGSTCPATFCGGTAWGIASCSSNRSAASAGDQYCGGVHALVVTMADGTSKTCLYQPTSLPDHSGLPTDALDGPLVGAAAVGATDQFCAGTSRIISAGQQLPSGCSGARPTTLCDRARVGDAGAFDADAAAPAIEACFDALGSICAPCCPATPPDCSQKPDGYPGYSCTPAGNGTGSSFCSCSCSRGAWQCGC